MIAGLRKIESPLIREVRGRGLLVGIEIDARLADAKTVVAEEMLERGMLSKDTHGTVVRITPPLNIEGERARLGGRRDLRGRCATS